MDDFDAYPIIDKELALTRVGGDEQLYDEIFALFLEDAPTQIADIRQALSAAIFSDAERVAHSLKSAAANVGATRASKISEQLELVFRGAEQAEIENLAPGLIQALETAISAINC